MRLQFILSEIGIGLRRNLPIAISVVIVTFVSLTFVGAAGLLQQQISAMKGEWYDKVEVTVYLCPQGSVQESCAGGPVTDAQRGDLEALMASPELKPYIQQVWFESQDEAYASYAKRFSDQWWFAETTAADIPASYRIKLTDPEKYQVVADVLTGRQGVEEVQDQQKLFDSLFLVLDRATLVSVGIAAVMLLAAVLLITTTIRLSALSRRRETGIMRLVGASNLFIQLPFMLEGAIAATVGALLAVGALWVGVHYIVADWFSGATSSWIPYVGTSDVLAIAPVLVLIAIGLAAVSSVVTLSRYTRV